MSDPTIRENGGKLAGFHAENVIVDFEAIGPAEFWVHIIDPATGREWDISCGGIAPGYATCQED